MTPRIDNEARIDVLAVMDNNIEADADNYTNESWLEEMREARAAIAALINAAQIHLQADDEISASGLLIALHRVTGGDDA